MSAIEDCIKGIAVFANTQYEPGSKLQTSFFRMVNDANVELAALRASLAASEAAREKAEAVLRTVIRAIEDYRETDYRLLMLAQDQAAAALIRINEEKPHGQL